MPHALKKVPADMAPMNGLPMGPTVTAGWLDNGMEVVVIPNRRNSSVRHMVWYRNGSSDDPLGKSGIAHFLEHLMFKGTERHPDGQFGRFLNSVGGSENAFTGWSYTSYYQHIPSEHLGACMSYEADRMRDIVLSEKLIGPERGVVLAERGMAVDSHPGHLLGEALHAAAFPFQPCGRPIIGWRHEIETLGLEDVRAYYDRFYRPDNAILIVVGDVEPNAVMDMAARIYGPVARGETAIERCTLRDPPKRVRQCLTLASPAVRQPQLRRLHLVPSPRLAVPGEAEALELLAFLLADDRTSFLYRQLVIDAGQATSVGARYLDNTFRDHTLFSLSGTPARGISPERLEAGLDVALAELGKTNFSQRDLDRAKRQVIARSIFIQDDPMVWALVRGEALCCGLTLDHVARRRERIEAVTLDHLGHALTYLTSQTSISGHLLEAAAA